MRRQPLLYTEQFLFVLSFNFAPYFQLKNFFLFNKRKSSHPVATMQRFDVLKSLIQTKHT